MLAIILPILPNSHQNVDTGADNKNIKLVDLESVGQDHISYTVISQLLSNRFQPNFLQEWQADT